MLCAWRILSDHHVKVTGRLPHADAHPRATREARLRRCGPLLPLSIPTASSRERERGQDGGAVSPSRREGPLACLASMKPKPGVDLNCVVKQLRERAVLAENVLSSATGSGMATRLRDNYLTWASDTERVLRGSLQFCPPIRTSHRAVLAHPGDSRHNGQVVRSHQGRGRGSGRMAQAARRLVGRGSTEVASHEPGELSRA